MHFVPSPPPPQTSKMSGYQIRPCHHISQDPVLPRHLDPAFNDQVSVGYSDGAMPVKSSANAVLKKAVEADGKQAVPGGCWVVWLMLSLCCCVCVVVFICVYVFGV